MKLLQIRDKLTHLQRFVIFGIIYLISNLINGIDQEASLGILQIFGGFLISLSEIIKQFLINFFTQSKSSLEFVNTLITGVDASITLPTPNTFS